MFNKNNNKIKYIVLGCFLVISLGLNGYLLTKINPKMFPPSNMPNSEIMACADECDEYCYQNSTPENEEACFYSCASSCIISNDITSCSGFDADSLDMYNLTDTEKECLCNSLCVVESGENIADCPNLCTKDNNYNHLFYQFEE